jgi:hypothetical protein
LSPWRLILLPCNSCLMDGSFILSKILREEIVYSYCHLMSPSLSDLSFCFFSIKFSLTCSSSIWR